MIYSMRVKAPKGALTEYQYYIVLQNFNIVPFSYQSSTAAHGEGTLDQSNGLGNSSHHGGYHLGLLGYCDGTRLVHSDDGSGGGGRGCGCCAHLGCSSFQHPSGRVTDLQAQQYFKNWRATDRMHSVLEMRKF